MRAAEIGRRRILRKLKRKKILCAGILCLLFATSFVQGADRKTATNQGIASLEMGGEGQIKGKITTIPGEEEPKYRGEPISIKFRDADIRDVIIFLCQFGGLNVIIDSGVSGRVSCNLKNVPWDQALDIILKTHRLGKIIEGNVLITANTEILIKNLNERKLD